MAAEFGPKPWPVVGIRKLDTLTFAFGARAKRGVRLLQERGWKMRVLWARRTPEENDALVARGTASLMSKHLTGNALDLINRLAPYPPATADQIRAMKDGEAFRGEPLAPLKFFFDMRDVARVVGVFWGGNFRKRWDPTHWELLRM